MKPINFKHHVTVRLSDEQKEQIDSITGDNPDLYNNRGHFIRCAIIRLMKEHKGR